MQITEVRIKLVEDAGERLQAFCSITFDDCFVIRDLKIIDGTTGPFVAMPSRKLTTHCSQCHCKNHLRAVYCNQCGGRLKEISAAKDDDGRAKLYADIAHPINSSCREMIQEHVIRSFYEEIERSKLPGYVSRYDDLDDEVHTSGRTRHDQAHRPAGLHRPPPPQRVDSVVAPPPPQRVDSVVAPPPPQRVDSVVAPPHRSDTDRLSDTTPSTPHSNLKRDGFGAGIFDRK